MKQLYLLLFCWIFCQGYLFAQTSGPGVAVQDSLVVVPDSNLVRPPVFDLTNLLAANRFLNAGAEPVSLHAIPRKFEDKDGFFYLIAGLVLLLGIARTAYPRYFANMFRVFFNSSLRQSQLTDQLVQDKFPSLLFNLLFVLTTGIYFYLLMQHLQLIDKGLNWYLLGGCVLGMAIIYFVKYLSLQFIGWVTAYQQEAGVYTFIIFLINKIIGICLLPVVVVMAFSEPPVVQIFVFISFILIAVMLLMRFFRSYGLLQHRIKVSRFHFFLYIFSLEILPLFLIYKAVMLFFSIN